jgi:hypothetical protein
MVIDTNYYQHIYAIVSYIITRMTSNKEVKNIETINIALEGNNRICIK